MRLRIDPMLANARFVMHCLASPRLRSLIEQTSKSTSGVNNLNAEELRNFPLALPSLDEQAEIVRRVENLFALADAIEAKWQAARDQVERLAPALLAKAFRGELVPQDHNDEPVSTMLARIRGEQGSATHPKSRGRRA
jgi:type I restriction enzyme S subunit